MNSYILIKKRTCGPKFKIIICMNVDFVNNLSFYCSLDINYECILRL
jgi:hypothetical protein